jgi:hypothetical protein
VNLFAGFDHDSRTAPEVCDVAVKRYVLAAQVGEVANLFAVMPGDGCMKGAAASGRAERKVLVAILRRGDAENSPRDTSMLPNQISSLRSGHALDLDIRDRRSVGLTRLARRLRSGNGQKQARENDVAIHHLVGSILSELLKRLK